MWKNATVLPVSTVLVSFRYRTCCSNSSLAFSSSFRHRTIQLDHSVRPRGCFRCWTLIHQHSDPQIFQLFLDFRSMAESSMDSTANGQPDARIIS